MLIKSDTNDKLTPVSGAFIAINPRTGSFEGVFIHALNENEQEVVKQAVARIMRPPAIELLKRLLQMLGADIFYLISSVKFFKKLRILKKITLKSLTPFFPKRRCPNGITGKRLGTH